MTGEPPALIPARMVNEFSYCPRLFHIEWVQARFAENADTVDGSYHHRVVDHPTGGLATGQQPFRATSVLLSSPSLGLTGKADIVEGDGRTVVPVDYKRGHVPTNAERSFEPERVQLCVLGLLLRDQGMRCEYGELHYLASRTRVRVDFTDELVSRTRELLTALLAVASQDTPPPPLIDSPKCPRCSLVGLCLPDETNELSERSTRPARRLLPADSAARPLYVNTHGAVVGKSGARVEVTLGETLASVRLRDVSQVCVFGNAQVTTQLMRTLFTHEIPVMWFSTGGWFSGMATALPGKNIHLRRRQFAIADLDGLPIAASMIHGKIRNCRTMLMRNGRPRTEKAVSTLAGLAVEARRAHTIGTLLGIEGAAARLYYGAFPTMLRPPQDMPGQPFSFEGRNRRPPQDPVNAVLSFLYAMLVKDCTATLWGIGFDPYLGVLHRPQFGRPALALDLAEEFRPLIADSVALKLVNNGEIKGHHFEIRGRALSLTDNGRRVVLRGYERRLAHELRHPRFGYTVSYRRAIEVQARILGAVMLEEINEYTPLVTR